ncbi:pmpB [Symbiodinium sp. CCMP2456]|nr:pmpB [Symbiodinium sp. CCMP2456]
MQEMIQAFERGRLCKMVQDPLGSGAGCKKGLDCKDPMYAICCTDVCELHVAASCSDYSPACQARVAACEMASFMTDDGFLLAQPTYGENQIFDARSMGGYSSIVWKLLQDLTSLCYQLDWLRNDSSLLAKLSNYTGCQNIDESCPNNQASFETWPAGAEASHGSTKALISGGETLARTIMSKMAGFSAGVTGIVLSTALNLALLGTLGSPKNPCTYAHAADWGKCVYGQIAKYVEQYVTSYVAKELQHYTNEVAKTRLAVWHLKLNDINNSVAVDTREPGQNTTSNWLADFKFPVQALRFDMEGESIFPGAFDP